MANPNKFTAKEVLNKVLLDSSGNAVTANSVTSQEALNSVLDTTNNRLNMSLAGGTISGDVTIEGDLTVNGSGTNSYDEIINGDLHVKSDSGDSTSAFLVEKNDGTDVFVVDTTNSRANVGARVGTAILEVKGSVDNDYAGRFENTDSGGYGALVKIAGTTADDLAFQVRADSTNILTINGDSSSTFGGNVGIGSDSPISILEIKGTNSSLDGVSAGLVVHDSGSANAGLQLINNSGKFALHADGANDRVDFYLDDATTGSSFAGGDKILTLKYGGNVGISQDNPQSKLHINVGTDQNLEVTSVSSKLHLMGTNDARSANIPLTLGFTEYDFEGATGSTIRLKSTNSNITAPELVGKLEAYISDASGNLPGVAGSIDWTTNDSIDGGLTKGTNFTLKTYLESSGLVTAMTALADGNIGIGSTPKTHLDVQSYQADGITIGADNDTNRTRTDNTIKTGGITGVHYTNAEESIRLIGYASSSSDNTLLLGGGNGDWNSATAINFYVGANTTTTSGDLRFKLDTNSRISLSNNDSGTSNTIFGKNAGENLDAGSDYNVFVGENVSDASMADATYNVGVGYDALTSLTSGRSNIAVGAFSLGDNTTARFNTAVGGATLQRNTDGEHNTAIGYVAGKFSAGGASNATSPDQCVIIGSLSEFSSATPTNQIVIGYGADGLADNTVTLGNADITDVYMAQDSGALVHTAGIQFPASQVADGGANVLDDYEEGTWSVTDGSGAGLSFTLENNAYVKIGKLVTASAIVTFPSTSNSSSALLTLPFNASSVSSASGGAVLEQDINSTKSYTMAVDVANGVKIRENGSTTQTNANLSGKKIRFIITYYAS